MKEARFISRNKDKWKNMENGQQPDAEHLAANFIELSDDLAYARTFYPGSEAERYLNQLIAGYQTDINSRPVRKNKPIWYFWKQELPLLLASEYKTLLFAFFFFVLSAFVGVFSAAHDESFIRLILGDTYVNMTIDNITSGKPMGVYNQGDEWEMFLRITTNNIRVSFIAFAFGLFFSAGTLWILFSNGMMIGAFEYFFYKYGLLAHSVMSVWAHGTFEITSVIIAGAAGLIMGNSFLFPGTYPRLFSFRRGAVRGVKIVAGLVPFFILAGVIESYITRYADAMPVVGALCIGISAVGGIGYFIVYPVIIGRRQKLNEGEID